MKTATTTPVDYNSLMRRSKHELVMMLLAVLEQRPRDDNQRHDSVIERAAQRDDRGSFNEDGEWEDE